MIIIKSDSEINVMREAGKIAAAALIAGGEKVEEGVTTAEIDKTIHRFILSKGAKPSFLGYNSFPASACISINEEVIHGIPSNRILRYGDIVKIDVGAFFKGFHGDCADTFIIGNISDQAQKLINVTKESFYLAFEQASEGKRLGDISHAVQNYAESNGFSVVRDYTGHGVGIKLHEEPMVPNYGIANRGQRLQNGMTIAIEPMLNAGTYKVKTLENDWTVVTLDGELSAHYENTVAITKNGPEILTPH